MTQELTVPVLANQGPALAAESKTLQQALNAVKAAPITCEADREACNAQLVWVKTRARALEDERTSVTKPLNSILRTVNGWFKPATGALEQLEHALKDKLWRWDQAVKAEQQRQLEAASAAFQAGNTEQAQTALAAIPDVPVTAGTSIGTRLVLEIVQPDLVPREFCSPDLVKLRAVPSGTPIPGCVWKEVGRVSVRT